MQQWMESVMQIATLFQPRAGPASRSHSPAASFVARASLDTVFSVAVLVALAVVILVGAVGATALVFEGLADGSIRGQVGEPDVPRPPAAPSPEGARAGRAIFTGN